MKVLLDECVNHDLRPLLVGHVVATVSYLGWKGTKNGALLRRAATEGFVTPVTTDAANEGQHAVGSLPIAVVILHAASNRIQDLRPLVPECLAVLARLERPGFHHVG